jgi:phosphatidylinositol glycan class N
MSTFTLLPVIKVEDINIMYEVPDYLGWFVDDVLTVCSCRTYGALLMFFTGLFYLLFEDTILKHSKSSGHAPGAISSLGSRVIMGMQVRLFVIFLTSRGLQNYTAGGCLPCFCLNTFQSKSANLSRLAWFCLP